MLERVNITCPNCADTYPMLRDNSTQELLWELCTSCGERVMDGIGYIEDEEYSLECWNCEATNKNLNPDDDNYCYVCGELL